MSFAGMALAAQDVANTSQKGSIIVWPKVVVERSDPKDPFSKVNTDTVITLANDWTSLVDVKCYWMDEYQGIQDFMFRLTKNQVVWFRASDGSGMEGREAVVVTPFEGVYGELKCWAVDVAGDTQISHNHMFGTATTYDYLAGTAWEYSAWGFAARVGADGKPLRGKPIGDPGQLRLTGENDGKSYDACPQYLLGIFMANGSDWVDDYQNVVDLSTTDLTLVPCRQDLRQDRTPTITKAQFDIWNEDEVKSTGAYLCFKCWIETPLRLDPQRIDTKGFPCTSKANDGTLQPLGCNENYGKVKAADGATGGYIGHKNFDKFESWSLQTDYGFFRTTGVASTVCKWVSPSGTVLPSVNSPLIGVISKRVQLTDGSTGIKTWASSGTSLHTAGKFPYDAADPVLVQWDVQDEHPESNQR